MELVFVDIAEFEKYFNNQDVAMYLHSTVCGCGSPLEMYLGQCTVDVGDYHIQINECPIMKCGRCGKEHLCPNIPQEIYCVFFQMQKKGSDVCRLTMKSEERFEYCKDVEFVYDPRDLSIPGIDTDLDPTNKKGFSCPVFFDRKVLNAFYTDDDYELDFASESYGSISKKGTDGWEYDWNIVFGINKNDRVIMFLGDLATIDSDDRAIYLLKAYNVHSDHTVVDTELYQAQYNCIFSDPIKEQRIISLRNAFFSKVKKKYGIELFHLEQEKEQKGKMIVKPINYSKQEVEANIIILDGVLNEAINCIELRELYKKVVAVVPKNIGDLKTRKLLQGIIANIESEQKAKEMIAPLFCLNDLRVCFAHLISNEEVETFKSNVVSALCLETFDDYRRLYDTLIDRLYDLYRYLYVTEI